MVFETDELKQILKDYLNNLNGINFPIKEAYLFGSYAKGTQHEDSDIDIALVCEKFEGVRPFDMGKIAKAKWDTCAYISPMPFRPEDFTDDDWLVQEIKKTGIRLV